MDNEFMLRCPTLLLLAVASALCAAPVGAQAQAYEPPGVTGVRGSDDEGASPGDRAGDSKASPSREKDGGRDDSGDDQGSPRDVRGQHLSDPGPAAPPPSASEQPEPQPQAQPATATAPNIDPRLAAVAREAAAQPGDQKLHVLVFAPDPASAVAGAGGTARGSGAGIVGATIAPSRLDELASAPGVAYLMLDLPILPTARADADASMTPMPFAQLVGAPAAWQRGLSGGDVGVAVIDSGITRTADLPGRRLVQVRLDGQQESLDDTYGHGTFVGAIAAGSNDGFRGVAPGARLFAVNVARGDGVYTSDVISGLRWVLTNHRRYGIRVVSLSLSETAPSSYRANPLDTVVEQLWRAGVVVVVSAGNLGPGSAVFAPANDPFAIAVGALDVDRKPAAFSTSGTTPDGYAKPDLLAPGRHIVSALPAGTTLAALAPAANLVAPGYAMMSGTSMSAPQVAAAAAILLEEHPRWTPDEVKWLLMRTAMPVADSAGSLDLARAVAFAGRPRRANRNAMLSTFGLRRSAFALRRLREQEMPIDSPTFDNAGWANAGWANAGWANAGWASAGWK